MLERIFSALENECRLDLNQEILLGVSGGPDSLCLLETMRQLGCRLIVAHLDHGLRPGSAAEKEKIEQIAGKHGLPFVSRRADVAEYARKNSQSIEEAARNLRYEFLFEQAEISGAQAVAVGHTANDQVETVLMHFLRGSGLSGLSGMRIRSLPNPWSSSIPLVRPLLGIWREGILAFLEQHGLHPSFDESNQDLRFYRNRLRGELIPYLEDLNKGIRQRIWQTAEIIAADDEALESIVDRVWKDCGVTTGKDYLALDGELLKTQPLAIQRRVIRRAIAILRPGLRDIDFNSVERAVAFLAMPTRSNEIDLAANLRLEWEGQRIWLADWNAQLPLQNWPWIDPQTTLALQPPGEISLQDGWRLRARVFPADPTLVEHARANPDPWQAWLDLDRVMLPLKVRSRRPGERLRPLGMHGHSHKLSDYMINLRLPRRARHRWPLIVSGEEIAWLPGYTICETFSIRSETKQLLHLQLNQERRTASNGPALI